MKRWLVIVLGASLALVGCRSADDGLVTPAGCESGKTCSCDGGGESKTYCDGGGNEVCDCVCGDFAVTEPSDDFEACGGGVVGAWELVDVDVTQIAGHDLVHGCNDAEIHELKTPQALMLLDNTSNVTASGARSGAHMVRSVEQVELQKQLTCGSYLATSCENLGGAWRQNECGTCQRDLELHGIIDDDAVWDTYYAELTLSHPDFVRDGLGPDESYDFCQEKGTLKLRSRDLGIIYAFESRYLNGHVDSCVERSLDACDGLDGCHVGSCRGTTHCYQLATQADCEDNTLCTWYPDRCGGVPSKLCTIAEYGEGPECTVSKTAP